MDQIPAPTLESNLTTGLYSDAEKEQILSQIELAAGADRLTVDSEVFRPMKQGILFPVLVNVAAVVLIVGAWFAADSYFQTRQKTLSLKTDQLFSTESKLLAKVLEDAKAQMEAANAEINKIQGDLQKAASDKANLQKSFENRVAAQDKALRKELADAMAAERSRLLGTGLDADEVARRLKAYETQKNNETNAKLDEYKKQAQAEIDQRAQALAALQNKLQSTVNEQEKLRQEVEKQTKEREGALQTQLSNQAADLEALKKERDDLNLFFRQADTSMLSVRTAFESRDWAKTQAAVTSLRQLLGRASSSNSEAVRVRAQAQASLAESLEAAAAALDNSASKAEAAAQLEGVRAQNRKDLAAAAAQLEATQQANALAQSQAQAQLAEAEATAEGLRQALDALVARIDQSTSETFEARIDGQYFESQIEELSRTIAELTPYQAQAEALAAQVDALTLQVETLTAKVAALTDELAVAKDAKGAREAAFSEVREFTTYLRGQAPSPNETKTAIEKRTRTDESFKKVVEEIQSLASSGSAESSLNTAKTQLYGTVAAVSGTKVVLEPLTKVKPEVGQIIELRRTKGKKETVLGKGPVLTSTKQKVEVDWTGNTAVPLSGDAAYLVLP